MNFWQMIINRFFPNNKEFNNQEVRYTPMTKDELWSFGTEDLNRRLAELGYTKENYPEIIQKIGNRAGFDQSPKHIVDQGLPISQGGGMRSRKVYTDENYNQNIRGTNAYKSNATSTTLNTYPQLDNLFGYVDHWDYESYGGDYGNRQFQNNYFVPFSGGSTVPYGVTVEAKKYE